MYSNGDVQFKGVGNYANSTLIGQVGVVGVIHIDLQTSTLKELGGSA